MRYKIVIDSCGELLDEWKNDERFESVPLTLMVGAEQIIDDETRPTKHTGGRGMPPGAWILRRKSPEKQAAIKSCCLQVQKMIRLWTFTAVRATTVMKRRHLSRGCEEILFSTHCLL